MKFGNHWRPALWSSLAAAVSLLLPGVELFCINTGEFTFSPRWVAGFFALVLAAGWSVLFFPQLLLGRWKHRAWFTAMVLAVATALWWQSAMLAGIFPDVSRADWQDTWGFYAVIWGGNAAVFLGVFAAAWYWRNWCARNAGKLCLIILAPQLLQLGMSLREFSRPQYDFIDYTIVEKEKFHFGRQRNVIVLVVDCMGEKLFKETLRQYPELYGLFRDFTCFDRMESRIPRTMFAVPALLTGVEFPESEAQIVEQPVAPEVHAEYLNRACRAPDSLFQVLRRNGYRCEGYPFILQTISYSPEVIDNSTQRTNHQESLYQLVDYWALRMMPFFIKPLLSDSWYLATDSFVKPQEDGRVIGGVAEPHDKEFFLRLSQEARTGEFDKVFKYLHLQGAHQPLQLDDTLETVPDASPVQQLRGTLRNVELLIRKLQQMGLYDRTLLVVTGDHTERYDSQIVTLVKRPWERHEVMPVNSISCRVEEVAGTVLAELKLASPEGSLFRRQPVIGSWQSRETRGGRHRLLTSPRPVAQRKFEGVTAAGNSFWISDGILHFNNNAAVSENSSVQFYFVPTDTGNGLATNAVPGLNAGEDWDFLYTYQVPLRDLPDGRYQIYQIIRDRQRPDDPDTREEITCLPRYLEIARGGFTWLRDLPDRKYRAMTVGEEITFAPLMRHEALVLPPGKTVAGNTLRLNKNERLGILLPQQSAEPLSLEIEYRAMSQTQGALQVLDGENALTRRELEGITPCRLSLPLSPELLARGRLELGMEVVPRYRNRDARSSQASVQILSLRLNRIEK